MLHKYFKPLVALAAVCLSALLSGCPPGWDLPEPERTGIEPLPGDYTFNQRGCFSVRADDGRKVVVFGADCFRFDEIKIEEGGFRHEHGEIDGTHCPTDSYGISGTFKTETRAEGVIKYAFDCEITEEARFIAEHRSN